MRRLVMKYQWEKAPERMAKDIRMEAEGALQGDIIMDTMGLLLVVGLITYLVITSEEIESIIFVVFLLGIGLFFLIIAFVVKIRSYYQAKKGKFMKLETEFLRFAGGAGRYGTAIEVLIEKDGKLQEDNYKLIGIPLRNLQKGSKVTLLRTECDYDVFFAKE